MRLATYNIHRCIGRDGGYRPERIRTVLRELDADVIALQEVELLHEDPGLLEYLCDGGRWRPMPGMTMTRSSGHYGNALLSRYPVQSQRQLDISQPGREPRGAIHVNLRVPGGQVTVTATHLGLRPSERRAQARRLIDILETEARKNPAPCVSVLMGDLNEWFIWGRPLRWLERHFSLHRAPHPATYPARRPLFALDRIWADPVDRLLSVAAVKSPLTREASDHLPVVATIRL